MTQGLTKIAGVPDSEDIDRARGMAHFPGSGPAGKTCGDCDHRGYSRQSQNVRWNERRNQYEANWYRHAGCEMFKALTCSHGPVISSDNKACKYFEAKRP